MDVEGASRDGDLALLRGLVRNVRLGDVEDTVGAVPIEDAAAAIVMVRQPFESVFDDGVDCFRVDVGGWGWVVR